MAAKLNPYLGFDPPLERDVQAVGWGPLTLLMQATNFVSEAKQVVVWAIVLVLVFLVTRRGAVLILAGGFASGVEEVLKRVVERPRPSPLLVHVSEHETSYGFPSGHATFFTWLSLLLVAVLLTRLPRPWRPVAWVAAAAVIAVACLGRVWVGAHWPSDVAGGFLLGAGWTSVVLVAGLGWARSANRPAEAPLSQSPTSRG